HLADRVVGQVVAGDRQRPEHLLVLAGGAQRGGEADLEPVLPLAERGGDVGAPGAGLVLQLGDPGAVEHHGGGGVEGVGDQVDPVRSRRPPVEARGVGDVALARPGQVVLVAVQVRVLDQPGGVQVGGQGAGHGGGHVADGDGGGPVGDGQVPALMQGATGGGAGRGHAFSTARARWSGMGTPRRWASARKRGLLPGSGAATSSCLVNSAWGSRMTWSASPRSTTSPRYITRISSEKCRAVARSWVM